jgi:hypothetical protein
MWWMGVCAALVQPYCVYISLVGFSSSLQNVGMTHTSPFHQDSNSSAVGDAHCMRMQRRESGGQERCSAVQTDKAARQRGSGTLSAALHSALVLWLFECTGWWGLQKLASGSAESGSSHRCLLQPHFARMVFACKARARRGGWAAMYCAR